MKEITIFLTVFFCLSITILSTEVISEEIFTWTDEEGNVHFTNIAPPNQLKDFETIGEPEPIPEIEPEPEPVEEEPPIEIIENTAVIKANELIKNAYHALKKLQARVEIGISYKDYSPALGEALYDVNLFTESSSARMFPSVKLKFGRIILYYKSVGSIWDMKFSSTGDVNNFVQAESTLGKYIHSVCPNLPPQKPPEFLINKAKELGLPEQYYSSQYHIDSAISCFFGKASIELKGFDAIFLN